MGRYLTPGHTYEDGQTISGPSMTEHVSEALLKPTAISEQVLKDPVALTDEVLINDNGAFKKTTLQQLKALVLSGLTTVPAGAITDFAGADAPEGWFLCEGQEISRETYSVLYTVIGTTYGAGNGSSSFNLPDLRGRVTAGVDAGAGRIGDPAYNVGLTGALASVGGAHVHQLTEIQMPYHAHTVPNHGHPYTAAYMNYTGTARGGTGTFSIDNVAQGTGGYGPFGTTAAGGNYPHNNVQPTMMLNKIIKY